MNVKDKNTYRSYNKDTAIEINVPKKKNKIRNKKNEVSKSHFFIRVALLVFAAFCIVTIVKLQFEFNQLKDEKDVLIQKIEVKSDRIGELEARLKMDFNEEYIIRIAKEKLNLRLPEEIIFYNDLNN